MMSSSSVDLMKHSLLHGGHESSESGLLAATSSPVDGQVDAAGRAGLSQLGLAGVSYRAAHCRQGSAGAAPDDEGSRAELLALLTPIPPCPSADYEAPYCDET